MIIEEKIHKMYKCEVCGRTANYESTIIECEEKHKCLHPDTYLEIEACDYYDGPEFTFTKRCKLCKTLVGHIRLLQVLDDRNDVMLDILKLLEDKYPHLVKW